MPGIVWIGHKVNMSIIKKEDIPEIYKTATEINSAATGSVAKWVQKKFQKWLSPGREGYNIGASGRAAENIKIQPAKSVSGSAQWGWTVYEGNDTEANRYIRSGMKAGKEGEVTIPRLRMWAYEKGIMLQKLYHNTETGEYGAFVKVKRRSGSYAASEWGKRDVTISALYRIQRALKNKGSFRERSGWYVYSPHPKHQGRFDYPAYLFQKQRESFDNAFYDSGIVATNTLVRYLSSGKKPDINRIKINAKWTGL